MQLYKIIIASLFIISIIIITRQYTILTFRCDKCENKNKNKNNIENNTDLDDDGYVEMSIKQNFSSMFNEATPGFINQLLFNKKEID